MSTQVSEGKMNKNFQMYLYCVPMEKDYISSAGFREDPITYKDPMVR